MGTMTIAEEVGKRLTMDEALGSVMAAEASRADRLLMLVARAESLAVRVDGGYTPPDLPADENEVPPAYLPDRIVAAARPVRNDIEARLEAAFASLETALGSADTVQTGLD